MKVVVTVKLEGKGKFHHPKIEGICPVSGEYCSDTTGLHHSFVAEGESLDAVKTEVRKKYHITRIEEVKEKW